MARHSAAIMLLLMPRLAQLPFSDPKLGFAMTLPAEFMREGADPLAPNSIACWVAPSVRGQRGWIRVCAERRGGSLPRSAKGMTFTWKGLDLEGATFRSQWAREDVAVFAALVPLQKAPIWLVAMAPQVDRAHAQAALVATLATLRGASSRLSRTERASRAGNIVGQVVAIIFAIGVGMWIMKRRQRQTTQGR